MLLSFVSMSLPFNACSFTMEKLTTTFIIVIIIAPSVIGVILVVMIVTLITSLLDRWSKF